MSVFVYTKLDAITLPRKALLLYKLGFSCFKLQRLEEAIHYCGKALETQENFIPALTCRGLIYEEQGNNPKASEKWESAVKLEPKSCEDYLNLAVAFGKLEKYDDEIKILDKAIEVNPDSCEALFLKAMALSKLDDNCYKENILQILQKAVDVEPNHYYSYLHLGITYAHSGKQAEAKKAFERALNINPHYYEARLHHALTLLSLGEDKRKIIQIFDQLLQEYPQFYKIWLHRGITHADLKKYREAINDFENAHKINPDDDKVLLHYGITLGSHDRDKAIEVLDQLTRKYPNHFRGWLHLGVTQSNAGAQKDAFHSLHKAIKLNHSDPKAWKHLGIASSKLQRHKIAFECFFQQLQLLPQDDIECDKTWNKIYEQLGKLKPEMRKESCLRLMDFCQASEAESQSHTVLRIKKKILSYLGGAHEALKKYDEAIESYNNALEIEIVDDLDADIWAAKARILKTQHDYHKAAEAYEESINLYDHYLQNEVNPQRVGKLKKKLSENYYESGECFRSLKKWQESLENYENAVKITPRHQKAWYEKAKILLHNFKQYEEAKSAFREALSLTSDLEERFHILNELGNVNVQLRDFRDAKDAYTQAIDQSRQYQEKEHRSLPQCWRAYKNLGWTYYRDLATDRTLALQQAFDVWEDGCRQLQAQSTEYEKEGYGILQHAMGKALYIQAKNQGNPQQYDTALEKLNTAERCLSEIYKPTANERCDHYLEILQDLCNVYLCLDKVEDVDHIASQGSDILRRLQEERGRPYEKQRISLKYAAFQQFTVDQSVRNGEIQAALETAEAGKNTCLKWLLYDWETANHRLGQEAFNWNEVQRLLDATTAIIYWHLSPAALHTFILKQEEVNITLLDQSLSRKDRLEKLHQLETWLQDWQQSYQNYRDLSKAPPENFDRAEHPWRQSMPQSLEKLAEILDIKSIIQKLDGISQLILIPHCELHLLPLHALFEVQSEGTSRYTFLYLPSMQAGLRGLNRSEITNNLGLLSIQHPTPDAELGYGALPFADFEAGTIIRLFQKRKRPCQTIARSFATKQAVQDALLLDSSAFLHFTGHGSHNFNNPQASMLILAKKDQLRVKDISEPTGDRLLQHFELVSLSACETGATSDQAITHEYVGMASAFIQAGVGQVLSTLWIVEDLASALFIIRFYYNIVQENQAPVEALRNAADWLRSCKRDELVLIYNGDMEEFRRNYDMIHPQLKREVNRLRNLAEDDCPYAHPYFWTSFTLVGITHYSIKG